MRTLDCRRKLERGGGWEEKPFWISTLPFPLLFPFLVSPAMHVMHGHLFLAQHSTQAMRTALLLKV